ncbi:hypothetical protein [Devosia sp. FKR38]|uniref:hypothetical protein n=1 Tax=Devosia sp. FKR38 TaxID=2562312 RepID=UPI0010BFE145|nr:hypothetical protein [Devosia sp. FKR38]
MTPKEQAIHDAITTIEKALSKALDNVLPKVMSDLFEAGGAEYAKALQRAMQSVGSDSIFPRSIAGGVTNLHPVSRQENAMPSKDGRAPRGSVRRAVLTVLLPRPEGLAATEVVAEAQKVDPSISAGGIHNELNRQKGMIYLNEEGRWRVPPALKLGGEYYDLNGLRNPEKDRATEPREL